MRCPACLGLKRDEFSSRLRRPRASKPAEGCCRCPPAPWRSPQARRVRPSQAQLPQAATSPPPAAVSWGQHLMPAVIPGGGAMGAPPRSDDMFRRYMSSASRPPDLPYHSWPYHRLALRRAVSISFRMMLCRTPSSLHFRPFVLASVCPHGPTNPLCGSKARSRGANEAPHCR